MTPPHTAKRRFVHGRYLFLALNYFAKSSHNHHTNKGRCGWPKYCQGAAMALYMYAICVSCVPVACRMDNAVSSGFSCKQMHLTFPSPTAPDASRTCHWNLEGRLLGRICRGFCTHYWGIFVRCYPTPDAHQSRFTRPFTLLWW